MDPVSAALLVGAAFVSRLAGSLLSKNPKTPLVDNKPTSPSTRGSRIPILVGRRRIGPNVVWVGNRTTSTEAGAGGKGTPSSGTQLVYRESAHHVLCVGPGWKLHRIWSNGKVIFGPVGGISPLSHPSGTSVSTELGPFRIYWGEEDGPEDEFLAQGGRMGILAKWKFCMRIVWEQARLGGYPTWPAIEYEPEVRPYKSGSLVGVDYDSLPDRLDGSLGWLDNEPGLTGTSYPIRNAFNYLEDPLTGNFKTPGNQTAIFTAGTKFKVTGNSPEFTGRLLTVQSSSNNSGENSYAIGGTNVSNTLPAVTDASWVKSNITVTSSGTSPSGSTAYLLTLLGGTEYVHWNAAHGTVGGTYLLGNVRCQVNIDVENFGEAGIEDITFSIEPFLGGTTHVHTCRAQWVGGAIVFTNSAGVFAQAIALVLGPTPTWRTFVIQYYVGHGTGVSLSTYTGTVKINATNCSANFRISRPLFLVANSTLVGGGTTTIVPEEPIFSPLPAEGLLLPYLIGAGPGGANAAHLIDQLMFETHPHGAGIDADDFDIESLETIGAALEAEGLRTHVIGLDGEHIHAMLGVVFQDVGMLLAWDTISGKFKFTLLRDPSSLPSIPSIPEQLIAAPLPERFAQQDQSLHDRAFFGFADTDLAYRDNIVVDKNDALASIDQNQKGTVVQMPTVIDSQMAVMIADRRSPEVLTALAKSTVTVLRDAGDLYAGRYCTIHDFDSTQIVLEVQANAKSRRTVLEVATDNYSIVPSSELLGAFVTPPDPVEPVADTSVGIVELPEALRLASKRAIGVLRIRGDASVADAAVHISSDDLTFTRILDGSMYVTGLTLNEPMDDDPSELANGPFASGIGPDVTALSLSLTTEDRDLGRQLLIIDDEIMFVQEIEPFGENLYRPNAILRGQYGTEPANHAVDSIAYIVDPRKLIAIYDPAIAAEADIYIKTQPRTSNTEISLVDVESVHREISNNVPVPVTEFFAEVPTGTIDGVNDTFTLVAEPNPPSSLILIKNGLDQRGDGEDYSIVGATIQFTAGNIPQTGDTLIARRYLSL